MRRLKLKVAYDGGGFAGFQRQRGLPTVQAALEEAAGDLEGAPVSVLGAGRTDAGVHALGQVAALWTQRGLSAAAFRGALNDRLPQSLRVLEAAFVPEGFHPVKSAVSKTYRYLIDTAPVARPLYRPMALHVPQPMDREALLEALAQLCGHHDFAAFKGAAGRTKTTDRTLMEATYSAFADGLWAFEFTAEGFLNHMARILVGTLIEVGRGRRPPSAIARALASGARGDAGPTVAARGLCLVRVAYPPELDTPAPAPYDY